MDGLRVLGEVVLLQTSTSEKKNEAKRCDRKTHPEHVSILQVGLRISLLGVDEVRELGRVPDEKDGGVVVDPVPVALLGPQLHSETTGVAGGIGRTALAADSAETGSSAGAVANLAEDVGAGEIGDIVGHFEVSVGTRTFCVDDTLGNALTVEVGEEVDEVEVFLGW